MRKIPSALVAVAAALFGQSVSATNGYLALGYGPMSVGQAGACVAITDSPMCAANNPAVLSSIDNRWEIGVDLFMPDRGFKANNDAQTPPYPSIPPGTYESNNDWFLIPNFAYNRKLDDSTAVGLIVGGQGGMNVEYDSAIFRNFNNPGGVASSPTSMDLAQLFVGLAYSKRINDQHTLGLMPVFAVQSLEAKGLQPFQPWSASPDNVTNNGKDWSYGGGLRLGWLWDANDALKIGASYQTKLWMTRFSDYKGLLAEGGDFDVPPILDLGFSYRFHPQWRFAFNYQFIQYEDVASVSNPADLVFPMPPQPVLGTNNGLGFGWDNVNVYKFGLSWDYKPDLTFRAGYSYATDTFQNIQALFNVLAPAVVKEHFTLGVGKKLASNNEINLAVMYAPEERVHGTNPNTGPQTGYLYMDQWQVSLGWTFRM